MTTWTIRVTVNRVVDGDTFDADADLGWGVWRRSIKGALMRFRVLGVDTPERGQPGWAEATEWLGRTILAFGNQPLTVESTALDSFGRALCHVRLPDGTNLADLYPDQWRTT